MDYEYSAFVLAHAAPEGTSDWPALLERLVQRVQTDLDSKSGGGWELVSHDFLIAEGEMVATFFARRAKPG